MSIARRSWALLTAILAVLAVLAAPLSPAFGASVPSAPASCTAAQESGGYRVTWTAPASDGGSAVTSYVIKPKGSSVSSVKVAASARAYLWTGATTGATSPLTFGVRARNSAGAGAWCYAPVGSTPPPPPPPAGSGTPFKDGSYWDAPMGDNAPGDPNSDKYVADWKANSLQNYIHLVDSANWSQPVYTSTCSDPLFHIVPSGNGPTLDVHIPAGAQPASGTDSQLTVEDKCIGESVDLHHASYSSGKWTVADASRYYYDSLGIDEKVNPDGSAGNSGHRGLPAAIRGFLYDEVKAAVAAGRPDVGHRVEASWWATGDAICPVWPLPGCEHNKGGVTPEGIVVRIKPGVTPPADLNQYEMVLWRTLQNYGAIIGDNSNQSTGVKLEGNRDWSALGIGKDSLASTKADSYVFVKTGYDPRSGTVH